MLQKVNVDILLFTVTQEEKNLIRDSNFVFVTVKYEISLVFQTSFKIYNLCFIPL